MVGLPSCYRPLSIGPCFFIFCIYFAQSGGADQFRIANQLLLFSWGGIASGAATEQDKDRRRHGAPLLRRTPLRRLLSQ